MEVTAALAQGCSATGWVYALWGAHVWLIGQYPLHVQAAVFEDPDSLVSSVVNTVGTPERVDGGPVTALRRKRAQNRPDRDEQHQRPVDLRADDGQRPDDGEAAEDQREHARHWGGILMR